MSLDGFIAGPNGEADWIPMDPDIDFVGLFSRFDTALLGRRSYETTQSPGAPAWAPEMKVFVVSRTLRPADHPGVTIISDNLAEAVARLGAQPGKDIWLFGGGSLFRSMLDAGLVDAVEVAVIPVLLGNGIPLLPTPARRHKLTLTSQRIYPKTGTVLLSYAVAR
jgi:dihydrofolate reductase